MGQQGLLWSAVVLLQWMGLSGAQVCEQRLCVECWSSLWEQRAVVLLRVQQVQWMSLLAVSALEGLQATLA